MPSEAEVFEFDAVLASVMLEALNDWAVAYLLVLAVGASRCGIERRDQLFDRRSARSGCCVDWRNL